MSANIDAPTETTVVQASDPWGASIRATTDHAWPEPRGEVYVTMRQDDDEDTELMIALSPNEAQRLGRRLIELAAHARTKPVATLEVR